VHGGYIALIQILGTRTAELHRAFAQHADDPAFKPETATADDLTQWRQRVRADAATALDLLAQRIQKLPAHIAPAARALLDRRDQVLTRVDALRMPTGRVMKARHHGDYHLGQVLLSKNDFLITDFEGEPERTLEERRRKHSPLRDVAGLLRSFSYAAGAALARAATTPDEEAKLAPLAADWEAQTRAAFIGAYDQSARGAGLYENEQDLQSLIALFELEKALYELRYELNNRPDWVRWPLAGITRLVPA
jgi:maltose alpha-D-glucosyltransferase/alpha-amylase